MIKFSGLINIKVIIFEMNIMYNEKRSNFPVRNFAMSKEESPNLRKTPVSLQENHLGRNKK